MYYGVEQSTDMRCKRTKIVKFKTQQQALNWKNKNSGDFTYDDPDAAKNWHHTFRCVYEFCGKIDKKDKLFSDYGTSTYPVNKEDQTALYLWKYGKEIN